MITGLPQVADSADWKTSLYFHNMDTSRLNVVLYFMDDKGKPMNLPFAIGNAESVHVGIEPNNTRILETLGTGSLKPGFAAVFTCDKACDDPTSKATASKLAVFAVFRQHVPGRADSEAVVPAEMPEQDAHIVFDNRSNYATRIALLTMMGGAITMKVMDESGTTIASDRLQLEEFEKTVLVLADKHPATPGKYGCIEFTGSGLAAMGFCFNPNGSFTSTHANTIY